MSRQLHSPDDERDRVAVRRAQWRRELPEVDTIGMAILGRARLVTLQARSVIEQVFTRHGLDAGEFDVLSTMLRSGAPYRLRPTELFRSLMISSGGLTNRLDRLERAGLIARLRSESDARSMLVELTPAGRAKTEAAFREDMAAEARMLEGLSEPEREDLARLLSRLAICLADRAPREGEPDS